MFDEVERGQRPSASQQNVIVRALRALHLLPRAQSNVAGRITDVYRAPAPNTKYAYVVRLDREVNLVMTRQTEYVQDLEGGPEWLTAEGVDGEVGYPPAPGITFDMLEPLVARTNPPTLTDPTVLIIDDAVSLNMGTPITQGEWGGKIIEVNLHAQVAFVAPIVPAPVPAQDPKDPDITPESIDPTDTTAWSNPANFDLSQGRCVWIRGYTGYMVNQSVTVADVRGSTLPWATNAWNLTGRNFQAWCTPQGPFAPQRELGCAPPDDPVLCDTGACCLPQDCFSTTEAACASLEGGEFYPGQSCGDLLKSGLCRPQFPCCLPDGVCTLLSESDCDTAAGMFFPDETSCGGFECPQEVSCCFPDGTCGRLLEPVCLAARGTPVEDCGSCAAIEGCCIEYEIDFTIRQCVSNTRASECSARAWCLEFPFQCGWFGGDCSDSSDCV